ncbi:ABC transporter permease [Mucisphaera calidilacus]|uniref:Transport permease protein n=1 Tax=Mucisphaera calidilacus TaxID=2527982 RepID=A0A518C0G1_9BACT|nr:ABC transporter permease [Mucisphaera calidilacus]QDU72712.1 Inner membrane transport permease YbhR [Mucisphaera calidilacus]
MTSADLSSTISRDSSPPREASPALLWPRACFGIALREFVRFSRQRTRIIGALATPVLFWLLLGSGLNRAVALNTADEATVGYLAYFFPGTVLMIVLFTAVFSTITVIEDRREGFLQGVLVSPAPGSAVAVGKMIGAAGIATLQGGLFLLAWPFVGGGISVVWWLAALGVIALCSAGLAGLGLMLAWPMKSTAGFHALMNLILMPMWFLSGAVFPLELAPIWLRVLGYLNPMTYGHAVLTWAMFEGSPPAAAAPLFLALPLLLVAAVAAVVFATRAVRPVS